LEPNGGGGGRSEGLFYCLILSALLSSMSDLSSLNLSLVSFSLHGGENLQVYKISLLSLITLEEDLFQFILPFWIAYKIYLFLFIYEDFLLPC
jgi:hypothetical protein